MVDDSSGYNDLEEVSASEILAKIERIEPVEYDRIRIKGELDLSKLDLPMEQVARTEFQIKRLGLPDEYKVVSSSIMIKNSTFDAKVNFSNCFFRSRVSFNNTTFSGNADFKGAIFNEGDTFGDDSDFMEATFSGNADFRGTIFNGYPVFWYANFSGNADFMEATFSEVGFEGSTFSEGALFLGATFRGDADFSDATFMRDALFNEAKFEGEVLTFKDATFADARSQERACRRAKNELEKNGNREEAGYHFYREMEGKRKQKPWYIRYPEFVFIQLIFGYGVHPFRLIAWWFFFVGIFAGIYWKWNGVIGALQPLDYIWFSITVAVTPGFAGYKPTPGLFQVGAGLEAIFGTFMWAAFIATFARKYMR